MTRQRRTLSLSLVLAGGIVLQAAPSPAQVPIPPLLQLQHDVTTGHATSAERLLLAKEWIVAQKFGPALTLLNAQPFTESPLEALRHVLRGECFEGLRDVANADAAYHAALATVPNDAAALLRLGVMRYLGGDTTAALDFVRRATRAETGNPEAYYYLYLLAPLPSETAAALQSLLAADGPNGSWSALALKQRRP
jgi:Flp pilus assembly protein TadD